MRTAILLLSGFGLLVAGIAAIALDHPLIGTVLLVVGLALKVTGFLLGDSAVAAPGRGPQTLGGQRVERPRAGIPVGRSALRRGVVAPLRPARVVPPVTRHVPRPVTRHDRAS